MRRTATIAVAGALSMLLAACGGGAGTTGSEGPAQTEEAAQSGENEAEDTDESSAKDADDEPSWSSQVALRLVRGEVVTDEREGESLLVGLLKSMDWKRGVHLEYEHHDDHEDYGTDEVVQTNAKGESYFSRNDYTLPSYGIEGTKAEAVIDGTCYAIDTEEKTATALMEAMSDQLNNSLRSDSLYSGVLLMEAMHAGDAYTTEEREYEGKTYTAEVYPSPNEYIPTTTFLFDEDGKLAYCLRDALETANVGNTVYVIRAIDDNVDESLFDLSGYTITQTGE